MLKASSIVKVALCFMLMTGAAFAAGPAVGTTAGKTYSEWSAAWWQWAFSIPASENPLLAEGELDCTVGQSGPVWFLAGSLSTTAVRSCTVPADKPLFFPLLNAVYVNDIGEDFTADEKREVLEGLFSDVEPGFLADLGFPGSRACKVEATLDGFPTTYYTPTAHVQSPPFLAEAGSDPVLPLTPGITDPEAVSDGFWAMLPPLSPGEHTLRFGGHVCEFDNFNDHPFFGPVDVTYHLTVIDSTANP